MAYGHHQYAPAAYDETETREFDPVIDAAEHGEMAEVAAQVADGEVYRKDDLVLLDHEIAALKPLLRRRWLAIFDEGAWWLFGAIRECPTCAAELAADEQCEACIGPVATVVAS